jgi:hypothetical protein
MLTQVPESHHLDLYKYWLAQRGARTMPRRADLNPADIPALLPHLIIVELAEDQLRYRLAGTAVAQTLGRELTGNAVGSYIDNGKSAARLKTVYQAVFDTARPVFATSQFLAAPGTVHNLSMLILPLSDDGTRVNMVAATLAVRFNFDLTASREWLSGQPFWACNASHIQSAEDLKRACLEWERHSNPSGDTQHRIPA